MQEAWGRWLHCGTGVSSCTAPVGRHKDSAARYLHANGSAHHVNFSQIIDCHFNVSYHFFLRRAVQDGVKGFLPAYKGTVDGLARMVREEGWRSLYAGLSPALLGSGTCSESLQPHAWSSVDGCARAVYRLLNQTEHVGRVPARPAHFEVRAPEFSRAQKFRSWRRSPEPPKASIPKDSSSWAVDRRGSTRRGCRQTRLPSGVRGVCLAAGLSWGIYFFTYNKARERYHRLSNFQRLSPQLTLLSAAEAGAVVRAALCTLCFRHITQPRLEVPLLNC
jgi:hypothetical protein